jgi:peroxiredoxin
VTLLTSHISVAPNFELNDQEGNPAQLTAGWDGLTLLVFFRGHWCPYCRRYLKKLQANHWRFAQRHVRLLAISPEPPATSRALARALSLSFPILCDTHGAVIDRYGTRNGATASSIVLPHPAVFLIDSDGSIRFRKIDRNFQRRTTIHTLMTAINQAAQ